jgi:hypothetical protein
MVVSKVAAEGWGTRPKADSASRAGMVPQVLNVSLKFANREVKFSSSGVLLMCNLVDGGQGRRLYGVVGWMPLFHRDKEIMERLRSVELLQRRREVGRYLSTKDSARQSSCLSSELRVIHGPNCGCHIVNVLS